MRDTLEHFLVRVYIATLLSEDMLRGIWQSVKRQYSVLNSMTNFGQPEVVRQF